MQTSNKHIFIVTYDYPPSNGGIARLCFELKKYLEKKGLNVTVICPQSTSTDAEEDNNVVRLHGRRGILELRTLKYLRKKTVPGDIVITGNYHPEGMLSLLSNREPIYWHMEPNILPERVFSDAVFGLLIDVLY